MEISLNPNAELKNDSNLSLKIDCKTQPSTIEYSTVQHSTAQHSTAQHSTAQHSTAQHSTAQIEHNPLDFTFKWTATTQQIWTNKFQK